MKDVKVYGFSFACLLLVGCGGSGSSGSDNNSVTLSDADLSAESLPELAVGVTRTLELAHADGQEDVPGFGISHADSDDGDLLKRVVGTGLDRADLTAQVYVPGVCESGSLDFDGNTNTGEGRYTFSNCRFYVEGEGYMTFNGPVVLDLQRNNEVMVIDYQNTKVRDSQWVERTLDFTLTCDEVEDSCKMSNDYVEEGKRYRIENFDIWGDEYSGYTFEADIYVDSLGHVAVYNDYDPIFFDCGDSVPTGGPITLEAGEKLATIHYQSCSSFTVCQNSECNTYDWNDYR